MFTINRHPHNPILSPSTADHWASEAIYNWCPLTVGDTKYVLYRAQSKPDYLHGPNLSLSTIGMAKTVDGVNYFDHKQLIVPDNEWEMYGCEDPRATVIDGTVYIFYTALSNYPFSHEGIKAAIAICDENLNIKEKHLVTPFNAKAITLFPEKINDKYFALVTVHPDLPPSSICFAEFEKLEDMWSMDYWRGWYANYKQHEFKVNMKEIEHIEIGAAPLKTERGWLLVYSHIENYFTEDKIFGVRAMILNIDDPKKVISTVDYPFMVPEATYEKDGLVPNIVFPSGATVENHKLTIYYGGADTYCCLAETNIDHMLSSIGEDKYIESATRFAENPVLEPIEDHPWEALAVFNPAAIEIDGKVHLLYRAQSHDYTSVLGYASSSDGFNIDERLPEPVYVPRADFEQKKNGPNGFSGCEDPRLTILDGRILMFYTAYDGVNPPKIAYSGINIDDFTSKRWNWDEPKLVSPEGLDDKDACVFPEKINGNYVLIHRLNSVVCIDYVEEMDFEKRPLDRFIKLFGARRGMWDTKKVGLSSIPIKTEHGWVLIYHGVSDNGIYRVGVALLELENPAHVISRVADYIFEPKENYEKEGTVPNVVFPCGAVVRDGKLLMYYGGGDKVIGVASLEFDDLMDRLLG